MNAFLPVLLPECGLLLSKVKTGACTVKEKGVRLNPDIS
jgi:hypothetical protein